ncbi:hypothetical protein [Pandoraea soli]|nr:hypothetical protein [Pandoraea soli]
MKKPPALPGREASVGVTTPRDDIARVSIDTLTIPRRSQVRRF